MTRLPPTTLLRAAASVRAALQRVTGRMVPPEVALLELASGFMASRTLFAVAELGVADVLADGPRSPAEVAAVLGTDPDATHRLLRACAAWGVFHEGPDGRFALTPAAGRLRSGTADSMRDVVLMLGHPDYQQVWGGLAGSVRTGAPVAEHALGRSLWEHLDHDPAFGATFDDAMSRLTALDWPTVAAVYDFSRFSTIADVGGGHGQLLALMLSAAPTARGILLEREAVARRAEELLRTAGVLDRVRIQPGSFFDAAPDDADLYVLRRVLHDFDDEQAAAVLTTLHSHMPDGATLLVVESVVPTGNAPHLAKALDLDMMVFVGGRERTDAEWRTLLTSTGFEPPRIVPTLSSVSLLESSPRRSS
ncbi:methyltransferase [Ornithinimicrobium sp. W1679]|uniref:methyltransferase n=1 Tax=Ornithinimicrobium sp. W1679 TaxID=3418770 RepID=UPI003CF13F0F